MNVRHARRDVPKDWTLCGIYCGFHRPLRAVLEVEGWQNVTCRHCLAVIRKEARLVAR